MSRAIDGDKLFEYIQKEKAWKQNTVLRYRYDKGKQDAYYEMLEIIQEQPTMQNGGWIPFTTEYDEELKMDMLQGQLPDDEQEIIVTNGTDIWMDTFMRDGIERYLDSGNDLVGIVTAWQPLPELYKEEEQ